MHSNFHCASSPLLHTLAVPVFLLISWTTNHYFSSDCTGTSVPPYSCSCFNLSLLLRYILKLFPPVSRFFISFSPLWISILALKSTCWENHLYGLADEAEETGLEALDLTPRKQTETENLMQIFLGPRLDHAEGNSVAKI